MALLKACYAAAQHNGTAKLYEVMDDCAAAHFSARSAFVYSGLYGLHLARWFDAMPPQQMLLWVSALSVAASCLRVVVVEKAHTLTCCCRLHGLLVQKNSRPRRSQLHQRST